MSDSGGGAVDQQVWLSLAGRSDRELAGLVALNHAELVCREARVLLLAAAWADAHEVDTAVPGYQPLVERACAWGGVGTPEVSEYCAAELGALQGTGMVAARMLIADALDLRHRLPLLWSRVQAGEVRAWQARKVAETSRPLPYAAARDLDLALSGQLGMVPWSRFQKLLTAAVLAGDPAAMAERERRARTERDVWSCDSEDGLKLLVARAASGDVAWFVGTVNRIADILAREGDTDLVGARRARAIGILAQPARALQLLLDHRGDQPEPFDPTDTAEPSEPSEPAEPDPPGGLELSSWPVGVDLAAARPRVVLHLHLSEVAVRDGQGLVRPEHGDPLTLEQLRAFLTGTGCVVQVRPVLDPAHLAPVDGYEVPARMREAMRLRYPSEVFPYGSCSTATADLDHTTPYRPPERDGPPGQTSVDNLGPLSRAAHRAVTHGRWRRRQPEPGRYLFRSPTGHIFLVTNQGTQALGDTTFATHVWQAAVSTRPVAA